MKQAHGWHLPDHEQHLIEWMAHAKNRRDVVDGRVVYQGVKQRAALEHVKQFRTAVDVGAHCGLWSFYLAKQFAQVHAFEPVAAHRECFLENVKAENVQLYDVALGERAGSVGIHTKTGSSGDSWVSGDGPIPMRCLDEYALDDVDFVKIDTEGHELFVLRGAEDTLKRCKPTIIVEQKPGRAQMHGLNERDALPYLESLGATLRKEISGDFIFAWD